MSTAMQLSETRFVKIEGTSVTASVNTAEEARHAAKEVRQKKREFAHIKRDLLRQKKAAERQASQAKRKRAPRQGFLSKLGSAFATVASLTSAYGRASAIMDLPRIERECATTDEILHNLDAVLIQIEGKLLHHS